MLLPPAMPSNLISKCRATNTANPDHLLQQLLYGHLAASGHNIISYLHHIPDDRQCVRQLSGMLLLYDLLHVHRPGRRSFIRRENTRVRDFDIPSHAARIMMPWSLTSMYPMRVKPRMGVWQHSGQQLRRHLSDR